MAIETSGPDGKPFVQQVELTPAGMLLAYGVTPETLHTGERVTLRAHPSRAGAGHIVLGLEITKSDGTVFPLHPLAVRDAAKIGGAGATGIAGTWLTESSGFVGLAGAAASWPLTDKARQIRLSADRKAMQQAMAECIPVGPPTLMAYPVVRTIAVDAASVLLDLDWMGARRVVQLDARAHPTEAEPTLLGHSLGRWEGGTLVVDTVGFAAHPEGMGFGTPSGRAKHVVERFALSAARTRLDYDVTVEDPEYFTAPVTYHTQWQYRPDLKPSGIPCDLETARRFLTGE